MPRCRPLRISATTVDGIGDRRQLGELDDKARDKLVVAVVRGSQRSPERVHQGLGVKDYPVLGPQSVRCRNPRLTDQGNGCQQRKADAIPASEHGTAATWIRPTSGKRGSRRTASSPGRTNSPGRHHRAGWHRHTRTVRAMAHRQRSLWTRKRASKGPPRKARARRTTAR